MSEELAPTQSTRSVEALSTFAKVVEVPDCRYGPMLAFDADEVITASLRTYGEWSEHEIDGLSIYIRDGTLVLDVGSNIGTHALAFARRKPRAMVWGFEPRPLVSSLAWTNCARNGARNVVILATACGDKSSEIVLGPPLAAEANVGAFTLPPLAMKPGDKIGVRDLLSGSAAWTSINNVSRALVKWLGTGKLTQFHTDPRDPVPPLTRVRIVPLDSLTFPLPVSLIKIDVEGMESAVLSGARSLLERDHPAVYFETLSTEKLATSFAILQILEYRLYWMETHQYNRANFRNNVQNIWWRTELGVLALPYSAARRSDLVEVDGIPAVLPYRENARLGINLMPPNRKNATVNY